MDMLQIKYDALQQSYDALRSDLKHKDKIIDRLTDHNRKLQSMVETYETDSSRNDSLDSGSSKNSVYDKNLEIINEAVTDDEYKLMEDLNREKQSAHNFGVEPRSNIIKKFHTDAEEEFFLLSVLSAKIDLATKGCSNSTVSDISPQNLWNIAQEEQIAMHQFHDWIMNELLKVFQNTQNLSTIISHTWKSTKIKINNNNENKNNKNNTDYESLKQLKHKNNKNNNNNNNNNIINKMKYQSPKQLHDEEQILTDEESDIDEDEIVTYNRNRYLSTTDLL